MTRRLLTLVSIACAIALLTAALAAPVRLEGAALPAAVTARVFPPRAVAGVAEPAPSVLTNHASRIIDVQLGDGIFRVRIRAGRAGTSVTLEVRFSRFVQLFIPAS